MPHKTTKTAAEAAAKKNELSDFQKAIFDILVKKLGTSWTDTDKFCLAKKMKLANAVPKTESEAKTWATTD